MSTYLRLNLARHGLGCVGDLLDGVECGLGDSAADAPKGLLVARGRPTPADGGPSMQVLGATAPGGEQQRGQPPLVWGTK